MLYLFFQPSSLTKRMMLKELPPSKTNLSSASVFQDTPYFPSMEKTMESSPISISSRNVKGSYLGDKNSLDLEESLKSYLNIEELEDDFELITSKFKESIYESILKSNNCMLPCFNMVCDENDEPHGSFAIIDIGGSTLRVSVVNFLKDRKAECTVNKSWLIEENMKHLDRSFFKWAADNFKTVIDANLQESLKNSRGNIKLGITWSFPIIQNVAANRGIVSDLGKGFSISDEFKGKDLKDIFEDTFNGSNVPIEVYSIVNDSISVYITGSYFNDAKLGLVQGTGVNSCFLIDAKLLGNEKKEKLKSNIEDTKLLVNTEASFLGYHLNKYITNVDCEMNNSWKLMDNDDYLLPHFTTDQYGIFQPLEIITAGRYIPEIIRRIAIAKINNNDILCHISKSGADAEYSLSAETLSRLYQCDDIEKFKLILQDMVPTDDISIKDLNNLKIITKLIIHRASLVLASYILALLEVTNFKDTPTLEISVVGSMLQYFPGYKEKVLEILRFKTIEHNTPQISFDFIKDSSIYGASVAAYVNQQKLKLL